MDEDGYVLVSNLTRLRAMSDILRHVTVCEQFTAADMQILSRALNEITTKHVDAVYTAMGVGDKDDG